MATGSGLPRRFGLYVLTSEIGRDALGQVFRALRLSAERGFVRLRIFESAEISEDAVLDAIQENGEIHTFLKDRSIARGVQMDAVDGVPFLAWNESSGRTLDFLLAKARSLDQRVPVEHALLIAEKVATALDHAYNTTIDGERTLHGLVWPGFVTISDDGETRLAGFGLAAGFFPSFGQPGFVHDVEPYLAPEERSSRQIAKNSDVFSVGALLFELLVGRLPSPADPLADLRSGTAQDVPLAPEVAAVLRMCLCPPENRYQSSGELRRELGKLLFAGPYSPSTFNLAFFLNQLFSSEIDEENRYRAREAALDPGTIPETPAPAPAPLLKPASRPQSGWETTPLPTARAARRGHKPFAIGGVLLLTAAVAGTVWVISRKGEPRALPLPATPARVTAIPQEAPTPELAVTSPPTTGMSEAEFKDEVSRRLAQELKRLEEQMKRQRPSPVDAISAGAPAPEPSVRAAPLVTESPTPVEAAPPTPVLRPLPLAQAEPTRLPLPEASPAQEAVETPPKIQKVVKPTYPPIALKARIGGIVILRVLVSETGLPLEVGVVRGIRGGLSEAAVAAVQKWTFEPGRRNGSAVKAWTTIPIPFEP